MFVWSSWGDCFKSAFVTWNRGYVRVENTPHVARTRSPYRYLEKRVRIATRTSTSFWHTVFGSYGSPKRQAVRTVTHRGHLHIDCRQRFQTDDSRALFFRPTESIRNFDPNWSCPSYACRMFVVVLVSFCNALFVPSKAALFQSNLCFGLLYL